jgi:NitT/TauT family transport system permease protein/sulfonate transport system permease protein
MRRETSHPLLSRLLAEGSIVLVLTAWWLASRQLPSFILPSPADVALASIHLVTQWSGIANILASTLRLAAAIGISLAIGGLLAHLARSVPALEWVVMRRIQPFLNSFPSVGWAVLAVLWFGVSGMSVIFVEVVILVPFCLINIAAGLAEIDAETLEMARSFTRSRWRVLWRVGLPLLMPYLIATLRITYGIGWKIALVAELFGADVGLGFVLVRAQYNGQSDVVLAACLLIVAVFFAGEKLVIDPLARRFGTA